MGSNSSSSNVIEIDDNPLNKQERHAVEELYSKFIESK